MYSGGNRYGGQECTCIWDEDIRREGGGSIVGRDTRRDGLNGGRMDTEE